MEIGRESEIGARSIVDIVNKSHANIESEVLIEPNAYISCDKCPALLIGAGSTFATHLLLIAGSNATVHIGKDNMFSYFTKILNGHHKIIDQNTGVDITNHKCIRTGDHVWVGVGATLLPSCDVGEGSVVGAGAIVTKEIPAHVTSVGIPAKVMRENIDWER